MLQTEDPISDTVHRVWSAARVGKEKAADLHVVKTFREKGHRIATCFAVPTKVAWKSSSHYPKVVGGCVQCPPRSQKLWIATCTQEERRRSKKRQTNVQQAELVSSGTGGSGMANSNYAKTSRLGRSWLRRVLTNPGGYSWASRVRQVPFLTP